MLCIPHQRWDIQTRYVLTHSICFCIPRQRRDIQTRYVLTHSICLLRKRGIYLISNWSEATIYRVWAKREHIEFIFREHISRKWIYRQKEKWEQEYKDFLLVLLLFSACIRVWAYPILHLSGRTRCSHLVRLFKFFAKNITHRLGIFYYLFENWGTAMIVLRRSLKHKGLSNY